MTTIGIHLGFCLVCMTVRVFRQPVPKAFESNCNVCKRQVPFEPLDLPTAAGVS